MIGAFINAFNFRDPLDMSAGDVHRLRGNLLDALRDTPWKGFLRHRKLIRRTKGRDRQVSASALAGSVLVEVYRGG